MNRKRRSRARFARPPRLRETPKLRFLGFALARVISLAGFGIAACVWALVHVKTTQLPPMIVPIPPPAPTYDADAGEIPVPDWATEGD